LGPLARDLAANCVSRVRGIVNGTTNHILTAMATEGSSYEAALRDAQAHGYAEADPAGDVEGHDAANKIVILARLAFGGWAEPAAVTRRPPAVRGDGDPGITGVTATEVEGAAALGLALRLVASAAADATAPRSVDAVAVSVMPTAVPASSALGATSGVRNRIEIVAEPIGCVGFDGSGAGGAATSSAVLGDLLAIGRGAGSTWDGLPESRSLPADAVRDGLDAVRAWFFVLPGRTPASGVRTLADTTAELPGGTAIRTKPIGLDALRGRLLDTASDIPNIALYPVDA
jgi:homoserine dehydrogenase